MLDIASRSAWAVCTAFLLVTSPAVAQTTALLEDFEDATVAYTTTPAASEFNDGDKDFFTRTDGSNISGAYSVSGFNGSFYFAAQDTDGDGEAKVQNLVFSGIDVTGLSSLQFTALFAEDDDGSNEDWDDTASDDNYVRVYASVDGAAEQLIFAIEGSNPGGANGAPRVDDDLDGIGEGTEITEAFAAFSASIAGAGSTLTLRIEMNLEDGDEDIAIDDVTVLGVGSPALTLITVVDRAAAVCSDPDDVNTCDLSSSSASVTAAPGEKLVVRYEAANDGDVTLAIHDLEDSAGGVILSGFAYDLAPGARVFLDNFGTAPLTPGPQNRTARWTADDGGGAEAVGTDTYEITVTPRSVACTTTAPLYISAFATGAPGNVTVTNSSATDTVEFENCTLAVFDGMSELVVAAESVPGPLAPTASYPFIPDVPAGPGAAVVSTAALAVGDGVGDAIGTVLAAVVYDATGTVYGECGRGPAGAQGGDLDPCDTEAGAASVSAALASLFGGAVASEAGSGLDLAVTVVPNPVAWRATISYALATATDVRVSVVDVLGREVAVLAEGARGPGHYNVGLHAAAYPAGVYVVRVIANGELRTVPITVAR